MKSKQLFNLTRVRKACDQIYVPCFSEIVNDVLSSEQGNVVKRSDLVHEIARRMDCPVDPGLSSSISTRLRYLSKKGVIVQAKQYGYWIIL